MYVGSFVSYMASPERVSFACLAKGHQLEKPTTLVGDLPSLGQLRRVLTKDLRKKYADARARKNLPPLYIKDENGRVHGTKALAKSAIYPTRFCTDLFKLWQRDVAAADQMIQ